MLIAGSTTYVQTPVEIAEGGGFWMPCASVRAGFRGAMLMSCASGTLTTDTSRCACAAAGSPLNYGPGGAWANCPAQIS